MKTSTEQAIFVKGFVAGWVNRGGNLLDPSLPPQAVTAWEHYQNPPAELDEHLEHVLADAVRVIHDEHGEWPTNLEQRQARKPAA